MLPFKMCIRDRIECDQKDRNNLLMQIFHDLEDDYMEKSFFHQLIQRKLGMKIPLEMIKEDLREYMEPVSYTHLDVYKRQEIDSST